MRLGNLLQDRRRELKLTVESVAESSSMAVGTIRAYEQSRRMPSVEALRSVLDALALDYTVLTPHIIQVGQDTYELAAVKGGNSLWPNTDESDVPCADDADVETIRLRVVRKVLYADMRIIQAIDLLLNN